MQVGNIFLSVTLGKIVFKNNFYFIFADPQILILKTFPVNFVKNKTKINPQRFTI